MSQVSFDRERNAILRLDDCHRCKFGEARCRDVKSGEQFPEGKKPFWGSAPGRESETILLSNCDRYRNTVLMEHLVEWGFPKDGAIGIKAAREKKLLSLADQEFAESLLGWCASPSSLSILGGGIEKLLVVTALVKQALIRKSIKTARCWDSTVLLSSLRRIDKQSEVDRIIEEAQQVDVLVIDEIAMDRATDMARDNLFTIVQHRYSRSKPIITTSKAPLIEYRAAIGDKTADRLLSMCVSYDYLR